MGNQGRSIDKEKYGQIPPSEETDIHFFVGRVLSVNVEQGVLSIGVGKGGTNQADITASYMPLSDSSYGAAAFPVVTAGTDMLCVTLTSSRHADITYALVPVNHSMDGGYNSSLQRAFLYTAENITSTIMNSSDVEMQRKLHGMAVDGLLYCHAHGMPFGALPGDYFIMDKETGCGLAVSKLQTILKGNAISSVVVSAQNGKTQVSGRSVFIDTLTSEDAHCSGYYVRNTGLNAAEALGELTGTRPVLKRMKLGQGTETKLVLDVDAVPFYRIQHSEGLPVNGTQDLIVGSMDKSVQQHTGSTEPPILSARRSSFDGSLQNLSAQGLLLLKSPYIYGIHQIGYGKKPIASARQDGKMEFDDLRESYEAQNTLTTKMTTLDQDLSDDEKTVNAALVKLIDGLLDSGYSEVFKKIMAKHGFGPSTEKGAVKTLINAGAGTKGKTSGATDEQFYDLPKSIEIENPVTGEKRKYYDSTSFISQEPDGSICLKDGYGSEIRMCRGNIYISPALDLMVRTGRDFSVMAGRHQSYDSMDTCTINSTRSSVYVRGWKDLRMDGGYDGVVTLQCHSISTSSNDLKSPKGGLSIVSNGDAAFTAGGNMWVGLSNTAAITGLGYSASNAENTPFDTMGNGSLIIGGGSNLYVYGKHSVLSASDFVGQFDQSCFSVVSNKVTLASTGGICINDNIQISPNIAFTCFSPADGGGGELKISKVTYPGGKEGSEALKRDKLSIDIAADATVKGDVYVRAWKSSSNDNPGMSSDGRPEKGGNLVVAGCTDIGSRLTSNNILTNRVEASYIEAGQLTVAGATSLNSVYATRVNADIVHVTNGIEGGGDHYKLRGTLRIGEESYDIVVGEREPETSTPDRPEAPDLPEAKVSRVTINPVNRTFDNPCVSGVVKSSTIKNGYFNSKYILARGFRFPLTYDVKWSVLPGMSWEQSATGINRVLNYAPGYADGDNITLTAQYPGLDVWSDLKVSAVDGGRLINKSFFAVQTNAKAPSPRKVNEGKAITERVTDVNLSGKIE